MTGGERPTTILEKHFLGVADLLCLSSAYSTNRRVLTRSKPAVSVPEKSLQILRVSRVAARFFRKCVPTLVAPINVHY
jgi:hypothetical protein